MNARLGILCAALAASIYGLVPNIARLAFNAGIPALESVLIRTFVVALVLGFVSLVQHAPLRVPKRALPAFALQVLATLLVSSCYIAAVQFVPVGVAVLIFFTFPVLIALIAPLIEHRVPHVLHVALALFAFAGLGVAIGPSHGEVNLLGAGLAGVAALSCALQFFSGRAVSRHMMPSALGALVHMIVLPVVAILAWQTGGGRLALASGSVPLSTFLVVGLVGVTYCVGYFLHMSSVRAAPASIVAPYFNIEPVVTTVIAVVLLGEKLSLNHVMGGAMVLAAIIATGVVSKHTHKDFKPA